MFTAVLGFLQKSLEFRGKTSSSSKLANRSYKLLQGVIHGFGGNKARTEEKQQSGAPLMVLLVWNQELNSDGVTRADQKDNS